MTWLTIFIVEPSQIECLSGICGSMKDETFKFYTSLSRRHQGEYALILISDNEKQAFRRGMWLKDKSNVIGRPLAFTLMESGYK